MGDENYIHVSCLQEVLNSRLVGEAKGGQLPVLVLNSWGPGGSPWARADRCRGKGGLVLFEGLRGWVLVIQYPLGATQHSSPNPSLQMNQVTGLNIP